MTPHVDTHALERAIAQTSHGTIRSLEARRAALAYDQLQEVTNEHQVPISGIASTGIDWATFTVAFDVDFFFAPYQRDSPLSVPHFSYGAVVQGQPSPMGNTADPNNPDSLVAVSAVVVDWSRDEATGAINGAAIGVGATVGSGAQDVAFSGYVHLTFTGWGAPNESVPQLDTGQ